MKRLLALSWILIAAQASAEVTGNDLLSKLKSTNAGDSLTAYYYILGVMESESINLLQEIMITSSAKDKNKKFSRKYVCPPDGASNQQIFDIVQQHLESNPDSRHFGASVLVRASTLKAWPCAYNP